MSIFTYVAINHKGRSRRGEIEADSEREVRQKLKKQGLVAQDVQSAHSRGRSHAKRGKLRLNGAETTLLLEQLATLLSAGMPLIDSLGSIAEGMESRRGRTVVASLRQHVLEGESLAEALKEQGLDDVICNMVAAGEETGQLEVVVERLSSLLDQRGKMQQELLSATLYPAIITGFGFVVMVFLLTVVIPQVVGVFERAGSQLPLLTRVVISLSEILRESGGILLISLVAAILLYLQLMRHEQPRMKRDLFLLSLPLLGSLLRKVETARFARTLGMLLTGGVPVLTAMHIATQGLGLIPVRQAIRQAGEALREGESLADKLAESGYLPHMAVRLIAVGEQSGKLDRMLLRVADSYEEETSRNLQRMVTLLEPILVMVMALMVGMLAMAILLPIMQMNQLVR
ncbi:MAG: type II secretion system F family protein [Mariprofundaceae bacterium]